MRKHINGVLVHAKLISWCFLEIFCNHFNKTF
jgi:hypothetical protein